LSLQHLCDGNTQVTVNHSHETIKIKKALKNSIKLYVFVIDINLVYIWYIFRLDSVYSL